MPYTQRTSVQNLLDWMNGEYSGSSCLFYELDVSSGSVQDHIVYGEMFLHNTVGDSVWDSTTYYVSGSLGQLIRNYLSFRVLAVASGNIVTEGFHYRSGVGIERPYMLASIKSAMEAYYNDAMIDLQRLQTIGLVVDQDIVSYGHTAPPVG